MSPPADRSAAVKGRSLVPSRRQMQSLSHEFFTFGLGRRHSLPYLTDLTDRCCCAAWPVERPMEMVTDGAEGAPTTSLPPALPSR